MKITKVTGLASMGCFFVASLVCLSAYSKELAKVNNQSITDKDLVLSLSTTMNENQRAAYLKDVNSRSQVLFDLINREVLAQEAEKLKLDQEPDFKDQMTLLRKQVLMGRLLEKKFSTQMTRSAVRKYYEAHKYNYSTDRVHVQHILLFDEVAAKKMLAMAKDPNNDFQELAEKYSKDPSAKNNRGDVGFIGREHFVPEFVEAALSGENGQIIGPIKTLYGYHIIKVIEKRLGKVLEFDEVELQATAGLQQELLHKYVENIKGQYQIKVDRDALEKY